MYGNKKLIEIYWSKTWSKMGVATLGSQDSKLDCMSLRNYQNKLIYGVLIQIQEG